MPFRDKVTQCAVPQDPPEGSLPSSIPTTIPGKDNKAFWRHVRRQVQGQVHRFAAIVPSELASLCRQELTELGIGDTQLSDAGVEFSGRLVACMQANLWLRTASRVLCRLPDFRVGVVGELFHKVLANPWEYWLNPAVPLMIQSHAERSRVDHEGLITETVLSAIQERFRSRRLVVPELWRAPRETGSSDRNQQIQRVLVRLANNRCQISLDTSGAHLHRRGYRRLHGGAPMRETLASAILLRTDWRGARPLVDGMCGAGTVAIEGALLGRHIPPGLGRAFLFESWPAHERKTWAYIRRRAQEAALPCVSAPIVALDRDQSALRIAKENAQRAGVHDDIQWLSGDFTDFCPTALDLPPGLVVLDPPYGVRMRGVEDLSDLYRHLGAHLRESFKGWHVAVATPSSDLAKRLGFRNPRRWWINHGGIPVCICLATV